MPIMNRNTLGQPGSTGGAYAQWGPTSKGDQREGNERWDGNGGERILPKVNLSRISTEYARTHARTDGRTRLKPSASVVPRMGGGGIKTALD